MITLAIDFDGTIVDNQYPNIGSLKSNVVSVMQRLHQEGYPIIINTCRTAEHESAAREFLQKHQIPFDYFNENTPECILMFPDESRKISADLYIDDRDLYGVPDDWEIIYQLITRANNRHIERNCEKPKTGDININQ